MNTNTIRAKLVANVKALAAACKVAAANVESAEDRNCDKAEWNDLMAVEDCATAQFNRFYDMLTDAEKRAVRT